ncbi:MAG TPA: cytochrome c oxidase subunit 3, partial [Leptospiraceae bacterium]|nr:cytochrome c oxidase subunit 3 [Leptospiraceae bacterium]
MKPVKHLIYRKCSWIKFYCARKGLFQDSTMDNLRKDFLYPPGGILIWIIISLEVVTFAAGLTAFLVTGQSEKELFALSRPLLDRNIGWINTIVLLTGGLFMANAIHSIREGKRKSSSLWMIAAGLAGITFLVLKCVEYSSKLKGGHDLGSDSFFTLYWLLTGFHFLHVALATVILLVLA